MIMVNGDGGLWAAVNGARNKTRKGTRGWAPADYWLSARIQTAMWWSIIITSIEDFFFFHHPICLFFIVLTNIADQINMCILHESWRVTEILLLFYSRGKGILYPRNSEDLTEKWSYILGIQSNIFFVCQYGVYMNYFLTPTWWCQGTVLWWITSKSTTKTSVWILFS